MPMTITEALAEIAMLEKRLESKRTFVLSHLVRSDRLRDPHEKAGGSMELVKRELQGIDDLMLRKIFLRTQINKKNMETQLLVGTITRSIAEWLIWRREVLPGADRFSQIMLAKINSTRADAAKRQSTVAGEKPDDVIVNINEKDFHEYLEQMVEITGALDGKLSLHNATTLIAD